MDRSYQIKCVLRVSVGIEPEPCSQLEKLVDEALRSSRFQRLDLFLEEDSSQCTTIKCSKQFLVKVDKLVNRVGKTTISNHFPVMFFSFINPLFNHVKGSLRFTIWPGGHHKTYKQIKVSYKQFSHNKKLPHSRSFRYEPKASIEINSGNFMSSWRVFLFECDINMLLGSTLKGVCLACSVWIRRPPNMQVCVSPSSTNVARNYPFLGTLDHLRSSLKALSRR